MNDVAIVHYLERARAHPFLKWAGGKRALVPEIVKLLPDGFGDYYEPFLGGGAAFFALDSRIRRAHLSDVNADLMLTWQMLKKNVEAVIAELETHAARHGTAHYLSVRQEGHDWQDPVKLAARFIYLNRTCYNGLYRVNKAGRFNVPMGSYKNPNICDEDNLLAVAEVLKDTTLHAQSFERITPKNGDLVYCDPPYDEAFAKYTDEGFDADAQTALRNTCLKWVEKGAHVIISNSDTPFIRSLYGAHDVFQLFEVEAPRNINCNGNGRGKTAELLICGE